MRRRCIALLLLAGACGGDQPPPTPADEPRPAPRPTVAGEPARPSSGWDERAGPVLLVAGERPDEAFVIHPHLQGEERPDALEVTDYAGSAATLVGRRGIAGTVTLREAAPPSDEAQCTPWPRLSAPGMSAGWSVGFLRSGIEAIPVESLHAFASRDSARFVADVARLASSLAGMRRGEHAASFDGLPFVVKDAGRFTVDGRESAVAHVVRRVNQEANPLEEHTLLVLERQGAEAPWSITYTDHSVGPEETVTREELLGVVRLGGQVTLVLALDGGGGVGYALVQRQANGRWRQVWHSAPASC